MTTIINTICRIMTMTLLLRLEMGVDGVPQVPCLFIFGDSLSDSGNNNNLASMAKANFYPYGIDFPAGPTGRFTNGRTTIDLVGDQLGLEGYIPPFPSSGGEAVLKGVNYASGSAGIRPTTGYQVGQRVGMDQQLNNFKSTVSQITSLVGSNNVTNYLSKCIYSVYLGSNDWMLDYFNPTASSTKLQYTPEAFADTLITQLSQQLTSLHNLGARKVVLFGVGPLGCLPVYNSLGTCTQPINTALQGYNDKLRSLADKFNTNYSDSKFIYINTIEIVGNDLSGIALRVKNIPCCGAMQSVCSPTSTLCLDRNQYAYWDNEHTTEAANKFLANRAYKAQDPSDAYPMDISRLAQLQL